MKTLNPDYIERVNQLVNGSPYFELLSMKIRDVGSGFSVLEIDLTKKHLQPFGFVHGGVFASIIDAAAFWAIFYEVEDHNTGVTTVDLKVNYLAPAVSGKLVAKDCVFWSAEAKLKPSNQVKGQRHKEFAMGNVSEISGGNIPEIH